MIFLTSDAWFWEWSINWATLLILRKVGDTNKKVKCQPPEKKQTWKIGQHIETLLFLLMKEHFENIVVFSFHSGRNVPTLDKKETL